MKVLLIEHSGAQADLIRGLLGAHSCEPSGEAFRLDCAQGTREALERLSRGGLDAILLDMDLPGEEGFETLEQLRRRAPRIPVIALTRPGDHEADKAVQRGAQDSLTRTELSAALLARTLRYAVGRKQAEEQLALARKMESIGQLAAGIAHEINTPVQYIGDSVHFLQDCYSGFLKLVEKYHALRKSASQGSYDPILVSQVEETEQEVDLEFLQEEVPRAFQRTLDGVERVTHVVRAMKEFSYPSPKEKMPADLNQAIQDALTVARNEYKYVADVKTDLAELPPVVCHIGDLNQVFLNLIVNAAHAISEAVGKSGRRGQIRIVTQHDGDHVTVSIADTGCGIPEELRSRVFDPFFTTKRSGQGTGQGLAIAQSIVVDKHGGALSVESEAGKGACFVIRLPVNGVAARPAEVA